MVNLSFSSDFTNVELKEPILGLVYMRSANVMHAERQRYYCGHTVAEVCLVFCFIAHIIVIHVLIPIVDWVLCCVITSPKFFLLRGAVSGIVELESTLWWRSVLFHGMIFAKRSVAWCGHVPPPCSAAMFRGHVPPPCSAVEK